MGNTSLLVDTSLDRFQLYELSKILLCTVTMRVGTWKLWTTQRHRKFEKVKLECSKNSL